MDGENTPAPAAPSKLLPLLLVANSVLLAAILAVVLMRSPGGGGEHVEEKGEAAEKKDGPEAEGPKGGIGPTAKLPDFVIRLRDPEMDRYVRFTFELELNREEDREAVTSALPRIRDSFIAFLSDRTLTEMRGSDGLNKLKTDLMGVLDQAVPGRHVKSLFVTDFVVQ